MIKAESYDRDRILSALRQTNVYSNLSPAPRDVAFRRVEKDPQFCASAVDIIDEKVTRLREQRSHGEPNTPSEVIIRNWEKLRDQLKQNITTK